MKNLPLVGMMSILTSMGASAEEALVRVESSHDVKVTADRFEAIATEKGLNVFARIDHKKNAESVGMELRPTELIIFGNPKVGTPLMQCAQEAGLDLPQKVLVTEDESKKVWITYDNPNNMAKRHDMSGCEEVLGKVSQAMAALSAAAAKGE